MTCPTRSSSLRCRRSAWSAAAALAAALAAGPGFAATASYRVHFPDGRTLEVASARIDGDQAILTLSGAEDRLVLPASRILKVEAIEPEPSDPPEAVAADPGPEAGLASTVPPVAAAPSPAPPAPAALPAVDEPTLESMIRDAAARHGIEPDLLAAVIAVESGYRADALSPKGAQGLMQLMPGTARDLAVIDPFDPAQNIDAGARYLKELLDAHDGAFWKALAAYNAGMGRVARYNGVPPYKETIQYVKRVLDRYQHPQAVPAVPRSQR